MKHNFSGFLKAINLVIVTALMLSFTFQGKGVIGAQAKSSGATPAQQFGPNQPQTRDSVNRLARLVKASAGNSFAAADTSYLNKLDSHLQDTLSASLSGENVVATAKANGMRVSDTRAVLMDVYVNGSLDQAASQLKDMGMQVLATNDSLGKVVEGFMPVDTVLAAAQLSFTQAFLPVMGSGVNTGSVTSQGDGAHNGPAARLLGPNGAGVKVGIISDSMDNISSGVAGSQSTGDLPANVNALWDDPAGEDEGRAMGEIIYDTAPGVTNMYFYTGTMGSADKAANIRNLVGLGVNVIADDTFNLEEPFFQDGQVAQAVDYANGAGVAYFASAGNRARQSYESYYRDTGNSFHAHDFDPGSGSDWGQTIATIPDGYCMYASLQWDDPWGHAANNYDFWLHDMADPNINDVIGGSYTNNIATGLPVEFLYWCNNWGYAVTVGDEIDHTYGPGNSFLKFISSQPIGEYNTSSEAIDPDAASAKGAMTVAAVAWNESGLNDPEYYSSRGPSITRLFNTYGTRLSSPDVRLKPNIAGADCVATSHNFLGSGFGGGVFCGTSAAAPSVAGVAALVLSDKPGMTPSVLYAILGNSANTNDCNLAGNPDADCGAGFLLANNAVAYANTNVKTITSTVGGVVRGTYQLLPSGSMRVNYAGLDSGPVKVQSSGAVPIIAAERDAWAANGTTTSFAQLMGLPASQLSDTYVFPAYNNVTLNEQLRIGNVDSVPTTVTVTIGGVLEGTYPLAANTSVRINYAGLDSGPVIVQGTAGVHIIAAERDAWAANGTTTSFVQLMGLPASQLSDTYVFPAYNNVTLNEQLRIGNVDSVPSTVTVTIGGVLQGTYPLAANTSVRVNYTGLDSGPVIVKGTTGVHIIAAERDAWTAGAPYNATTCFAQLMGLPSGQLSDTYEFPAYNNVTLNEQLRIGNVDTVPTTVTVTIGGVLRGTYPLAVNGSVRVNYAGLDSGPVVVHGTPGVHIIAAERDALAVGTSITSFIQLMGLPAGSLSDTYLFPAYNNVTLNEQLRFAVP